MRTIFFLLRKEFRQILRNKAILPIMFVLPIIQLLVLVHATTFEIRDIKIGVVDLDKSNTSERLIAEFNGSSFFKLKSTAFTLQQAEGQLANKQIDMIICIPQNMERDLVKEKKIKVQLIPNAINSNFATIAYSYASNVLIDFNQQLIADWAGIITPQPIKTIETRSRYFYNAELNYKWYMFPGIMVILITMIGFLSGLNLVREKEIGTSEQLNVTPMKKYHFIIGKLLPFLMIGVFELCLAILLGRIVYGVPFLGKIGVLVGFTILFLLVILGIGLFISTMSETQQQMMFITFFTIIVFILLSGIFTPVESMPAWVQKFNLINPLAYFMKIIRMVMLKGAGFKNLTNELIALSIYAISILSLATFRYRKTS